MLNISPQEVLLILVVALLVVGPRRLPELGRSIGKGIREIRKAQDEVRKTIQVNLDDDGRPTFDDASNGPRRAPNGKAAASGAGAAAAGATASGDAREISRTLGRGLAEIRRARTEIERSFRVEMDTTSSRSTKAAPKPRRSRAVPSDTEPESPAVEDEGSGVEPSDPE